MASPDVGRRGAAVPAVTPPPGGRGPAPAAGPGGPDAPGVPAGPGPGGPDAPGAPTAPGAPAGSRRREAVGLWFRPGIYVKRWLLLLFASIVIISLGAAYALRSLYSADVTFPGYVGTLTLQFLPRWLRAMLFLGIGVGGLVLAFYRLGQSVLRPFLTLAPSDTSIVERIYSTRLQLKGPRLVAIGGGTGMSAMLRGIKKYTNRVTAIVTVADDGGSSGRLRTEYRVLPPGDFRQCLTALAETEPLMTELFSHRFLGEGSLAGHSFGNLFIMAMAEITGSFETALSASGRVLNIRGQLLPSTLQDVVLCATSGAEIRVGESRVPDRERPIDRVFLDPPNPPINPDAELAILDAELITVGPGSLYTSILPNLLVEGMVEALRASPAVKVYVCNVATQPGETDHLSVSQHLDVIEDHVGGNLFDYVVVNSNHAMTLPLSAVEAGIRRVVFDRERAAQRPLHFVLADVVSAQVSTHHDPEKLARVIMKRVWR